MHVLPVAAVYGGNASGKTNLFQALAFAKRLVVRGTQPDAPIPVKPFLLDGTSHEEPTRFVFELLLNEVVYEFAFAVTAERVVEESLTRILSTSERVLYRRHNGTITRLDSPFLEFAFQGTRENELFLTNAVSQKVDEFRPVWSWFRDSLQLIGPSTEFLSSELLLDGASPLAAQVSEALAALDTGVVGLGEQRVRFEDIGLPPNLAEDLREKVRSGTTLCFRDMIRNERYVLTRNEKGDLQAGRLVARHLRSDGSEVTFDLRNEADGTQRVIDLLPAFCDITAKGSRHVFVVDELDRSLHSLLTRQLLGSYLDSRSSETRAQLIFTTHDLLLMDQDLLRRDEMWVTERDFDGSSSLISIGEYEDVRYDKDLRKSYLQGRLGGVPRLLFREACALGHLGETDAQ
jgi:AAA15 family ATPase/GTPase